MKAINIQPESFYEVCLDANSIFTIRCEFLPVFETLKDAAQAATESAITSGVKHSVWRKSDRKRVFQAIPEIKD